MKRRDLLALAGAAAVALPMSAGSQPVRVARLGVLRETSRDPTFNALFKRLGELGWAEGRNLTIEFRSFNSDPKVLPAQVKELVGLKCDVILAHGTPAALTVHAHAPSMPMVFLIGGDPVALGLVASLARPWGHATGYLHQTHVIAAKQLQLLREWVPAARHVAVMFEAGNPSMEQAVRTVQQAGGGAGLTVRPLPLHDWKDVDAAETALMREPVDGLLVLHDRVTSDNRWNIANMSRRRGLPTVYGDRHYISAGTGLVSYGIDWPALVVGSADYLARILGSAKPAHLPVQQPSRFELIVNLHLARAYGVNIPQSLLLQATELIQ